MWTASSEFGTYRLCEQRRFRWACASTQSHQNLRCSLIQAVSQEEPSDRKPDPWPLWMAGHAHLKFVMTECSKTHIRLTGLMWSFISWARDYAIYFEHCRMDLPHTLKIVQCVTEIEHMLPFGQCDPYFTVQWFFNFWCIKLILVLLVRHDSGELCCPATALIKSICHNIKDFYSDDNLSEYDTKKKKKSDDHFKLISTRMSH